MTKFKNAAGKAIDALQWKKTGDTVPGNKTVAPFRNPAIVGEWACTLCGVMLHYHGQISTDAGIVMICPNDWVVADGSGADPVAVRPDAFEREFEPA